MREYPKAIKRQLRELNGAAYEAALRQALTGLAQDFDAWRQGKMDSFLLTERIHQFHQGPARKLFNRYANTGGIIELNVAAAIVDGLLDRSKISPEVLTAIGDVIQMIERNREPDTQPDTSQLDASL